MTRVSVALATYQGAAFVERQIESILDQSRVPDEVVVGDDGSTDGTLDLVRRSFARPGAPELRDLPVGGGLGVGANFSRILAATRGDVVLLSDQDDVWARDRVEAVVAAIPDGGLVFGDARLVDERGAPLGGTLFGTLPLRDDERAAIRSGDAASVLLRRNVVTGATAAVHRALLDRALPVPPSWIHDEWLAMIAALDGRLELLDRTVIDYRLHGANSIGVERVTMRRRWNRIMEPRSGRNRRLAARGRELLDWAESAGLDPGLVRRVREKADFEAARAALPDARLRRVPGIARLARSYGRYASQGRLDVLRDLLQPV